MYISRYIPISSGVYSHRVHHGGLRDEHRGAFGGLHSDVGEHENDYIVNPRERYDAYADTGEFRFSFLSPAVPQICSLRFDQRQQRAHVWDPIEAKQSR